MTTGHRAYTRDESFASQKSSLLELIRRRGPISRREAARRLGLRSSSVSFHVAELIRCGVLEEVGSKNSGMGRPAVLLDFASGTLFVAGVLVEIHRLDGVVADLRGSVVRWDEVKLPPDPDGEQVVAAAKSLCRLLLKGLDARRVLGIGIGVPGFVDRSAGRWEECGLMPRCRDVEMAPALSRCFGLPAFVENDTRARALAEKWFAPERDFDDLLFVEIGEGVGAALLVNGRIRAGATDAAGELGHISIDPNGKRCYCGGRGCLESQASCYALFDIVRRRLDGRVKSVLPRLLDGDLEKLSVEVVRQALDAGDKVALEALKEFCVPLGTGLANAMNLLNPGHIVIGGSLALLGDHLLRPLIVEIRARATSRAVRGVDIRMSGMVGRPAAMSAAAVVHEVSFTGRGIAHSLAQRSTQTARRRSAPPAEGGRRRPIGVAG